MANLNKVMFIGRLTRDPEPIPTKSMAAKGMKFGFAVNNRKKDQTSGQWVDDPVFVDCEVWNRGDLGKQADLVQQNLRKGSQVFIEGHLKMDRWQDKTDGSNRTKLVLVVDNFQYLEPRGDGGMGDGGGARMSRPAPQRNNQAYPPNGGSSFDSGHEEMDAPAGAGGPQEDEIPF